MSDYEQDEGLEQSGADNEAPPEPQDTGPSQSEPKEAPEAVDNTPFHKHPRFQEVIQQNNEYKSQLQQYETNLREMQQRMQQYEQSYKAQPKPVSPDTELFDRLKKIDPIFGNKFEAVSSVPEQLAEFKAWKEEMETSRIRDQYNTGVTKLFADNKVPSEWQDLYQDRLQKIAMSDPRLTVNDLPRVFKEVHEDFSKRFEGFKRNERASYVVDKAKDANIPNSQTKGKTPAPKKPALPLDREEALREIAARAVKGHRASNET